MWDEVNEGGEEDVMMIDQGSKTLCALFTMWIVFCAPSLLGHAAAQVTTEPALAQPTVQPRSAEPADSSASLSVVLPIYNERGLELVLSSQTEFHLLLQPGDTFMLVSGNTRGEVDIAWVNSAADALRRAYPQVSIVAATSGLSNVAAATLGAEPPVEAVIYVYEPNFPNLPEFTWDFYATLEHLSEASAWARTSELRLGAKPTGRPLLQRNLLRYNWNYGQLSEAFDELFIQTQTYCKEGTRAFERALERVIRQVSLVNPELNWVPQVTVDPKAPNGTTVERAFDCAQVAQVKGLSGVLLWWSPEYPGQALNFLRQLRAPVAASQQE